MAHVKKTYKRKSTRKFGVKRNGKFKKKSRVRTRRRTRRRTRGGKIIKNVRRLFANNKKNKPRIHPVDETPNPDTSSSAAPATGPFGRLSTLFTRTAAPVHSSTKNPLKI